MEKQASEGGSLNSDRRGLGRTESLLLMGQKHCGKTTIGRAVAGRLGCSFTDLDLLLLELAVRSGIDRVESCRQLYAYSPEEFRRFEELAAVEATGKMKKASMVVAFGGGTVENSAALEVLLSSGGLKIYLQEDEQLLLERILEGGIPPFLDPERPRESWSVIYGRRHRLCARLADHVVCVDGREPEAVALEVERIPGVAAGVLE